MKRNACMMLAIGCVIGLPLGALAQPAAVSDPRPVGQVMDVCRPWGFVFGAGAHGITGEALMAGQQVLKDALDCGGVADPNDMLVFESGIEAGGVLLWWLSEQEVTVTDVFAEYEVVQTEDSSGHQVVLLMLDVGLQSGGYWSSAYLMVLRDDTLEVGAALPLTAECWGGFFVDMDDSDIRISRSYTCAEKAVDWCDDWYPPSDGGSGLGGTIGCAEQAAATNADCHNLACITNAYDCCERGHGPTYCSWEQWFTGGHSLEHVTCDAVYTAEMILCIPVAAIKGLLS